MTYSGYLGGLRLAGLKPFLFDCAVANGLSFRVTDHDKGWIRETIYYEVTGSAEAIEGFRKMLAAGIDRYQNRPRP